MTGTKVKKQPSVLEGVGVAAVASLAGLVAFTFSGLILGGGLLLQLVIALLALGYIIYLQLRSGERTGRISVIGIWLGLAVANLFLAPSMLAYLAIHLCLIWLVRVLYYYHGILPALIDLGLIGMGLLAAGWTWLQTDSLLLTFWSFFLVQALFVLIPKQLKSNSRTDGRNDGFIDLGKTKRRDRFEHAHQTAEQAVRQLTRLQ